ncbi:SDR family NAD(P)-dependent oxidoreductase [Spirosoma koreense]
MATVFITGAAGGLGHTVTRTLLTQGHRIITTRHRDEDPQKLPSETSGLLVTYEVDLADEAQVAAVIERAVAEQGPIDAAVLLAGGYAGGSLLETTGALIDQMMTINFKTAYHVVQPLFAHMSQQATGGKFILVGARPALDATAGKEAVAYALSKSLLVQLSEIINVSGKAHRIVSTVIAPSIIDTPLNRTYMPDADFDAWVKPQTIADTIAFVLFGEGQALRESVLKIYNQA